MCIQASLSYCFNQKTSKGNLQTQTHKSKNLYLLIYISTINIISIILPPSNVLLLCMYLEKIRVNTFNLLR